jgi:hypothetical protein
LLFHESAAEAGQSFPGRMGVAGSLNLFLLGVSLILIDRRATKRLAVPNVLVFLVVAVTVLVFLYYFYGIENAEPPAASFTIALHTVVAFGFLSASILLIAPGTGNRSRAQP